MSPRNRQALEGRELELHGRSLCYRVGGDESRQPVVLIHGITQDSGTWEPLAAELDGDAYVIAPDLPGHGRSENPEGDHSLGAYASNVRDLMYALDVPSATIVGHSLGGGVALQFAYQFPELMDRLVLVDSGGLGPDVSPVLRAAKLPGADAFLSLATTDAVKGMVGALAGVLQRIGVQSGTDLREMSRGIAGLADPEKRRAFLRTVDAVIGLTGQSVSARDKLYLAEEVPMLIIWGTHDRIIPLRHGAIAQQTVANSWLRVVDDAGHFPHLDAPDEVAHYLIEFLEGTEVFDLPREEWAELIRPGERSDGSTAGDGAARDPSDGQGTARERVEAEAAGDG